jgi:hypothetical protein
VMPGSWGSGESARSKSFGRLRWQIGIGVRAGLIDRYRLVWLGR